MEESEGWGVSIHNVLEGQLGLVDWLGVAVSLSGNSGQSSAILFSATVPPLFQRRLIRSGRDLPMKSPRCWYVTHIVIYHRTIFHTLSVLMRAEITAGLKLPTTNSVIKVAFIGNSETTLSCRLGKGHESTDVTRQSNHVILPSFPLPASLSNCTGSVYLGADIENNYWWYISGGRYSSGYHEVVLQVKHLLLMSSDQKKPRLGEWTIMINFLLEAATNPLSNASELWCSFRCKTIL
uniref:Uncharacterized protein n=1 Tax=Timema poppense TaxID=170557 RepID=A0A7R9DDV6_TIMPO|nr:unnamed protein product [Timema poppensis]